MVHYPLLVFYVIYSCIMFIDTTGYFSLYHSSCYTAVWFVVDLSLSFSLSLFCCYLNYWLFVVLVEWISLSSIGIIWNLFIVWGGELRSRLVGGRGGDNMPVMSISFIYVRWFIVEVVNYYPSGAYKLFCVTMGKHTDRMANCLCIVFLWFVYFICGGRL